MEPVTATLPVGPPAAGPGEALFQRVNSMLEPKLSAFCGISPGIGPGKKEDKEVITVN